MRGLIFGIGGVREIGDGCFSYRFFSFIILFYAKREENKMQLQIDLRQLFSFFVRIVCFCFFFFNSLSLPLHTNRWEWKNMCIVYIYVTVHISHINMCTVNLRIVIVSYIISGLGRYFVFFWLEIFLAIFVGFLWLLNFMFLRFRGWNFLYLLDIYNLL